MPRVLTKNDYCGFDEFTGGVLDRMLESRLWGLGSGSWRKGLPSSQFSFENGFDLLANAVHPMIVANRSVDFGNEMRRLFLSPLVSPLRYSIGAILLFVRRV